MRGRPTGFFALAVSGIVILGCAGNASAWNHTYLALGDSVTFGFNPSDPTTYVPSYGDQGFVKPFADALSGQFGGVRPDVVNLGIVGELSTSFFTAVSPPGWTQRIPALNLNYPNDTTAQNDVMLADIAGIHAAGSTVDYVSLNFGNNDFFYLVSTPAFQSASDADKAAMIGATLLEIGNNYGAVLTELAILAPEAKVLLPGYYNPVPVGDPRHDLDGLAAYYGNLVIQGVADLFGAKYVDLATPFAGNEALYTNYLALNDAHPNALGYSVIGEQMIAAVPEPSSAVLAGLGLGICFAWRRTRRSREV